jgi:hypothetical protein
MSRGSPYSSELSDGGYIPGRGSDFLSSPLRPDRLWGPLSLLSKRYHGLFRRG